MTEWHEPKTKLPEDGQECLLMPIDSGGLVTVAVYGPIVWNNDHKVWMDFFRDSEAGSVVKPDAVGRWTDWDAIKPAARTQE